MREIDHLFFLMSRGDSSPTFPAVVARLPQLFFFPLPSARCRVAGRNTRSAFAPGARYGRGVPRRGAAFVEAD